MSELELYYNQLMIGVAGINTWAMLLPVVVALWQRRNLNRPLKIFLYYCIATFLLNMLEQVFIWATGAYTAALLPYLEKYQISDTTFLQILFFLKNYIFLSWFYILLLPKKYGTLLKSIAIFLACASIINYCFIEGYNVIGKFNPTAQAFFEFLVPAFYLWILFRQMLFFPVKKNPYFWLSFGLIFTSLIGLILYLIGDAIYQDNFILFSKITIVRNLFDIISLIILAVGFYHSQYARFIHPPNNSSLDKL